MLDLFISDFVYNMNVYLTFIEIDRYVNVSIIIQFNKKISVFFQIFSEKSKYQLAYVCFYLYLKIFFYKMRVYSVLFCLN